MMSAVSILWLPDYKVTDENMHNLFDRTFDDFQTSMLDPNCYKNDS